MNTNIPVVLRPLILLILLNLAALASAQEVSIPDPGLNAAVRAALQKSSGPLTEQDLLSLTNLDAGQRDVGSIDGLEAARNLVSLNLQVNRLTDFSLPPQLRQLGTLDLSSNPLTNCFLPDDLTNLATLTIEATALTQFTLPIGLTKLTNFALANSSLSSFELPSNITSLVFLDLRFNLFTNFSLPGGLTNLTTFHLGGNPLTQFALPTGLTALNNLSLDQNQLTSFALPAGLTNLVELDLSFNQLTNVTLPADLQSLTGLDLDFNRLTRLDLPPNLTQLRGLHLRGNQFTNFDVPKELTGLVLLDLSESPLRNITFPASLSHLTALRLSRNQLTRFTLPAGFTNLTGLNLSENQLTNVVLPSDLTRLQTLNLGGNALQSITLPSGLTNLTEFSVTGNQLTTLTLPPDMTQVTNFGFLSNPLATLVLPEPLAATNLVEDVAFLRDHGVSVFAYPLTIQLVRPRPLIGAFQFGITGPPGLYTVLASTDLRTWNEVGMVTNDLGSINFTDITSQSFSNRFYRAFRQTPPAANMVFIAPNTFLMGSPPNELHRQDNEGPQTAVTLTRGFWIGKYEVTEGEYVSVMGTNPSFFPGDPSRPVSSVSWPDATNYCWNLTQRELAAGRIPAGSQYRLPTEAEWECAARAGTSTRFSYGDDPDYTSLTNHAWYFLNGHLTVHPVGQKLPNPWGLYDMEGNVWEWCQDWLGPLPGGAVTDPQGPPSNAIGVKVIRGGAYDFDAPDCRSARRFSFGNHPALTDTDLGFRVVLVTGP